MIQYLHDCVIKVDHAVCVQWSHAWCVVLKVLENRGKIWRGNVSIWRKKNWRINRSANRLLIVSTNLDGFSLANHGWFTKLSRYTGESLANWLFSSTWQKKVWQINRSANMLLIVSTDLDGFSLANHERLPNSPNFHYTIYFNNEKEDFGPGSKVLRPDQFWSTKFGLVGPIWQPKLVRADQKRWIYV